MKKNNLVFIRDRIKVINKNQGNTGFTLIELLIAMAVFAIISVVIVTVFDRFLRGYTTQQVTSDVIQKARGALVMMTADIKLAGLDPRETGNFSIVTADPTLFTYDFDTQQAGVFNGVRDTSTTTPERRSYRFLNGKLEQLDNLGLVSAPQTDTLIPEIDTANCRFEYLKADRSIIAAPVAAASLPDIVFVRVVLAVKERAGRDGYVTRTMDSLVLCRNMQFNAQRL